MTYNVELQIGKCTETEGYTETESFADETEMRDYLNSFINEIVKNTEREFKIFVTKEK